MQTIGLGGLGTYVEQPTKAAGFVGTCPVHSSGCTEYIDPVSKSNINIVFNSDFSDLDGDSTLNDGWSSAGVQAGIELEGDTLYRLARPSGSTKATLECDILPNAKLYSLDTNNTLIVSPNTNIEIEVEPYQSKLFLVHGQNFDCRIDVGADELGGEVEVKEALVSYRLEQDNYDKLF